MRSLLASLLLCPLAALGQGYTSYFTGSTTDAVTTPLGGLCLMGGATESDEAMVWFLQRAAGGDVLVLRASGSNGYNNYFYTELGVPVNSVETIVFSNASAANNAYVHQRIQQAEAIWFAGGDQWNYVSYWQNTPIDALVRDAITQRNIVVGGTSAGMAILAGYRFTAQNGTVTSAAALNNPYAANVTLDGSPFMGAPGMDDVVTDTHFDSPDRRGRFMTFIARSYTDNGTPAFGIACEEYTAACIADDGIAHVYGGYPTYQDFAWFVQANCDVMMPPETCTASTPLTWNHSGLAVKACKVPGTSSGAYTFDLNDRKTTEGGTWENWSVNAGVLSTAPGAAPDCTVGLAIESAMSWSCVRTESGARLNGITPQAEFNLFDLTGRTLQRSVHRQNDGALVSWQAEGLVLLRVRDGVKEQTFRMVR